VPLIEKFAGITIPRDDDDDDNDNDGGDDDRTVKIDGSE
jgi:hypothetical protein